jgi:hypothetical protein
VECVEAVDQHGVVHGHVSGGLGEAEAGEAADQGAERDARLEAGERCTEAVVDPVPEGQVRSGRAGAVEDVRARQVGRVAVEARSPTSTGCPAEIVTPPISNVSAATRCVAI